MEHGAKAETRVQLLKACPSKRPTNFEQLDYVIYVITDADNSGDSRKVSKGQF